MGEAYELNSYPRGYVLIINNETFASNDLERREGSKKDYNLLKAAFTDFGFKVKTFYNLESRAFIKVVKGFAKSNDTWKVNSFLLFVMTHGHKDKENPRAVDLAMTDGRYISSDWIKEKFSNRYCKALVNKPKIFFFQACRDNTEWNGAVHRPRGRYTGEEEDPLINDLLIVSACHPGGDPYRALVGFGAHRSSKSGAWFIQELLSVMKSDGEITHLYEILNKVDKGLRERFIRDKGNSYQGIYFENWSFNKLFFLSNNAYSVHKAARALITLSPILRKEDGHKEKKKPSASKPLLLSRDDLTKTLRGDRQTGRISADEHRQRTVGLPSSSQVWDPKALNSQMKSLIDRALVKAIRASLQE